MKFDKETIAVFAICAALILAWDPFCKYMGWIPKSAPAAPVQVKPNAPVEAEKTGKAVSVTEKTVETAPADIVADNKVAVLPAQKLRDEALSFTFNPNEGNLEKIVFLKYLQEDHKTPIELDASLPPGSLAVFGDKEWQVDEILDNSIDRGAQSYRLVRKISTADGSSFTLTQKWQFKDDYILNYSVTIDNTGSDDLYFPNLSFMGASLMPFSILTDDKYINRESDTIDYCTVDGSLESIDTNDDDKDFFASPGSKVRWCGVANKYFATLIMAEKAFDRLVPKRKKIPENGDKKEYYIAALGGSYTNVKIASGADKTFNFQCFNGPKIISKLAEFDNKAPEIMNLSWGGPMDWIAEKLLSFLIYLKGICGSYGWSIIIITIIVRLLFWPVTQKANKSMKRMQKLQPQMKEIREKYKDDSQTMNTKVMELYRKEKVNPLGGCLPILLQIPVFIALYSTLNGAVELRQVSFWWINDLAKPDTIAHIFGLAINPLVISMTGLMVLQQRLTPATMDPAQQKMMMFMPVVMLFMLYSLPAGLTLYWTVSQSLAIVQLILQKKLDSEENTKLAKKAA